MPICEPNSLLIQTETLLDLPPFSMVKVEGGLFTMGLDGGGYNMAKPAHQVKVSSFWMGQHQVTQELWEAVTGENPAEIKGYNRPVESVSWYDCVEFCNRLSVMQGLESVYTTDKKQQGPNNDSNFDKKKWLVFADQKANGYRIPTEAEWEFAAKGGNFSQGHGYSGGSDLYRLAWYRENSHREAQAVGMKIPNEMGLFDMSGNVWEWCWDWYGDYEYAFPYIENPTGHISGHDRVFRGGSWRNSRIFCSVSNRDNGNPHFSYNNRGFRLSRTTFERGT